MATGMMARYDGLADWYDARISTDVDDFTKVVHEATRVLRPDGVLVVYGVHPCFNGPHVLWNEDGSRLVHPSYRQGGPPTGATSSAATSACTTSPSPPTSTPSSPPP